MSAHWQLEFEYEDYVEQVEGTVELRPTASRPTDEATRVLAAQLIQDIEAERRRLDISKAELARRIGKDPAVVRRLLTTECNPELYTVISMARALGLNVSLSRRRGRPPGNRRSP